MGELLIPREIAEAFKNKLERTFQISEEDNENFDDWTEEMVKAWHMVYRDQLVHREMIHITNEGNITTGNLLNIIRTFKEKAPVVSGITRNYLLKAPPTIIEQYTEIFSAAKSLGYFPDAFKIAKIVMVPKPNKPQNRIDSFRPISLLEVPGKTFEKLLNKELTDYTEENNLLSEHQLGFRRGKGTDIALAITHETIATHLARRHNVTIVLRDVKGAFRSRLA